MKQSDRYLTDFLNVDLELSSKANLAPLVTAMGTKVVVLHLERHKRTYRANLEVAGYEENANRTIRVFCAIVRALPIAAVELWNSAKVRDFNVGVQAGTQPPSYEIALEAATVRAASEVNARIVLTVYGTDLLREGARRTNR
jgi:hypothetical protein